MPIFHYVRASSLRSVRATQKYFVREKGVTSLYRGLSSLIAGTAPKTALRFTTYA